MADDGITIKGLTELKTKLASLTDKESDACIRKALKAGAAIEQAAIEERAPEKDTTGGSLPPGALKADISVSIRKSKLGNLYAVVGPGKFTAHVARWVEYGHRIVQGARLHKGGKHAGDVPAHPFIRPAYEQTRDEVATTIATTLASEIEKVSNRKGTS